MILQVGLLMMANHIGQIVQCLASAFYIIKGYVTTNS